MRASHLALGAIAALFLSVPVYADKGGNNQCPVGLVSGLSLDEEFGPGTQALTQCLERRHNVKMVVQINQFTDSSGRPYGLGNLSNIIDDYETTHGMRPGKDYEIVVILHSPGGRMALKDTGYNAAGQLVSGRNPYQGQIETLMARGVKFYFCQNTTRAFLAQPPSAITSLPRYGTTGISATDQIIPGIAYTTAGLTSIADYQARGYQYIQP